MSKSVLITGAARGLGANLAREFGRRGYRLALTGRSESSLQPLADELRDLSPQLVVEELDVENIDNIPDVFRRCAQALDGLDIVVVNAGIAIPTPVGKGQLEQMESVLNINLMGAIASAEAAIELFREQGGGQLVGITSVAAVRGLRNQAAYCASKAGFSRYLQAARLETQGKNISVTELAPGFIDTDLNRGLASRPFVVSAEKGTRIMANLIERRVKFRYVPPWPWSLVARVLACLPEGIVRKM
jgi:NAD(P)-dependent dehydrogenase (short-subunit alcohol dehydrogenase family)